MFDILEGSLQDNKIEIMDCRSQSYDNASNMSGVYSGVQARFRERNELAEWVPCSAHSLNLVGSSAAESCTAVVDFFQFMQSVYVFLSASPQRWSKLLNNMNKKVHVVKSLSETRWSARSDACKALAENYSVIRQTLLDIAKSARQPPMAVHEAKSLVKRLDRLDTAVLCVIWDDILQKINLVSKSLQQPGLEIVTVVQLYDGLLMVLEDMRELFDDYETKAKSLSTHLSPDYAEATSRKRTRKQQPNDGPCAESVLSARDKFRTQVFYVLLDKLTVEMRHRRAAYAGICNKFSFLTDTKLTTSEVTQKAHDLVDCYKEDLERAFVDEFRVFSTVCGSRNSVADMLQLQIDKKLVCSFPNVNIAMRIYLSILGANCETERSFSVLKRIKNCLRSTLGHDKLSALSLLFIESELLREVDTEDVISNFAKKKCRKVPL